jgi:gamma-glutamyltranspeptidase/glutathione hydrolase
MNWDFPYPSYRMPLLARNCVATTQPLAAQAGLSMLAHGGNAVDAALATAIALTVVEPVNNGLGSDAFAIVWDGRELVGLNASGRSPAGWTPDRFTEPAMPHEGWNSAAVPGAVSAWAALSERFGKLPFDTLFEPAIRYASDGFLVPPVIADIWRRQVERLRAQPGFAETFLPRGRAPGPGEHFRPPHQAATLAEIAKTRGESFYRGALAETMARTSAEDGGLLTSDDLAEHRFDWVAPIHVDFRGHRIHEIPPNGQGIAVLIALGILERCDLAGLEPDSSEMLHMQIEALKLGAGDVRAHVADPEHMQVTVTELLDPARLEDLARTLRRSGIAAPAPRAMAASSTIYLAAADASGMMVSFIQSNYAGFGSGVVVPGTGIALNNRGSCFVTTPGHPNQVGPRKRPLNTIIPGFISNGDAPVAAFGVMGALMQPQGHTQVASRMLVSEQNPQAAIDAPRWRVNEGELWIEAAMPAAARAGLAERGHKLVEMTSLDFGAAQIIQRVEQGYVAATETRRDGCAVGF